MPTFSFSDIFSRLSPDLTWLAVGFLGIIFIIISFVLSYHWKRFGIDTIVMAKVAILYFSVSGALLLAMAISLVVYLGSIKI